MLRLHGHNLTFIIPPLYPFPAGCANLASVIVYGAFPEKRTPIPVCPGNERNPRNFRAQFGGGLEGGALPAVESGDQPDGGQSAYADEPHPRERSRQPAILLQSLSRPFPLSPVQKSAPALKAEALAASSDPMPESDGDTRRHPQKQSPIPISSGRSLYFRGTDQGYRPRPDPDQTRPRTSGSTADERWRAGSVRTSARRGAH
ncbi:hypothetical protein HMPREF1207_02086 [Paenibacillus sp. HGH0039]|nr:hypothetical protein HMPREF1207_02086 [Paenibacillus sp. HGH0039]